MPTNALANPLVLPILGLLVEQPRHAYAVFAELRHRYEYLAVRNATVYTLLETLTATGWVEATAAGERPVLSTTAAGRAALADKVADQVAHSDLAGGPAFATALAYLGILSREEASRVLQERLLAIREKAETLRRIVDTAEVSELHMIEAHYLLERFDHDASWLERTAERIANGEISWT